MLLKKDPLQNPLQRCFRSLFKILLFSFLAVGLIHCGTSLEGGSDEGAAPSLGSGDNFSGACITANDCAGNSICVAGRSCIRNILSAGCECAGDPDGRCVDFTGTSEEGKACVLAGGTTSLLNCCQGLSKNNARCEGPSGSCPFTLLQ